MAGPISINPYADVLNFPPGTPASVVNAVLSIRARSDAVRAQQDAQPKWWETGLMDLAGGITNKLLFPWLQNEFVNLPYQTDLKTMQTDQNIRQFGSEQGTLTSELNNRALNSQALANQNTEDFGNAIDAAVKAYTPTPESMMDTGPTAPYGPYEDPWTSSPGPQYSPPLNNFSTVAPTGDQPQLPGTEPTSMQGDVAPVNRDRIMTYTPENNPTTADMFRTVAGQKPFYAGLLAQAFEKNKNLSPLLDPLAQKKAQADLEKVQAGTENLQGKTSDLAATLPGRLQDLVNRGIITQARADALKAQSAFTSAKTNEQNIRVDVLNNTTVDEIKKLLFKSGGEKSITKFGAELQVAAALHPEWDKAQVAEEALKQTQAKAIDLSTKTAIAASQARVPAEIAAKEIPLTDKSIKDIVIAQQIQGKARDAVKTLMDAGFLPENDSGASVAMAQLNREMLKRELWNSPDVRKAFGVLQQLGNTITVGFDRGLGGDIGARIAAAYNLPKDPTTVSGDNWLGRLDMMDSVSKEALMGQAQLRTMYYQSVHQSAPQIPNVNMSTTGNTTGGGNVQQTTLPPGVRETP